MEYIKSVHVQRIREMRVVKNMSPREIQDRFPHLTLQDIEKALNQTSRKATH